MLPRVLIATPGDLLLRVMQAGKVSRNVYLAHHQHERNHQGLGNVIPFPDERTHAQDRPIHKAERLGGLLNFYHRAA